MMGAGGRASDVVADAAFTATARLSDPPYYWKRMGVGKQAFIRCSTGGRRAGGGRRVQYCRTNY